MDNSSGTDVIWTGAARVAGRRWGAHVIGRVDRCALRDEEPHQLGAPASRGEVESRRPKLRDGRGREGSGRCGCAHSEVSAPLMRLRFTGQQQSAAISGTYTCMPGKSAPCSLPQRWPLGPEGVQHSPADA